MYADKYILHNTYICIFFMCLPMCVKLVAPLEMWGGRQVSNNSQVFGESPHFTVFWDPESARAAVTLEPWNIQ